MRHSKILGFTFGLLSVAVLAALAMRRADAPVQQLRPGKVMPEEGASLAIELGLKDSEPTGWGGQIKLSQGNVIALRVAGGGMQAVEGTKWKAQSQATPKKTPTVQPVRVRATVEAPADARVTITTRHGEFSFKLGEVPTEQGQLFLDGHAQVTRGMLTLALTDQPTDDDFPAAATAPDGSVWVAYVAYQQGNAITLPDDGSIPDDWSSLVTQDNGDQIKLLRFDGKTWSEPIDVTDPKLDVWRPAVAVHDGLVSVVWSQKVGDDWDLHHRSYDPAAGKWSPVRRFNRPGSDINPVLVSRSNGSDVWLVWQGWSEDNFDIFVQHGLGEGPPATQLQIKRPANDWHPAAALDSKGNLLVAYDSYQKGNYDVLLQVVTVAGKDREAVHTKSVQPVAATPKFEARPSIAVDKHNRAWIAYEEADANWGKDYGLRWTGKSGAPFYLNRKIAVRVVENGEVKQPKGEVPAEAIESGQETTAQGGARVRMSMPRLVADDAGRVWLLYRRHSLRTGAGELWTSFATYHWGQGWARAVPIPNSEGFIDNRPALARLASGGLVTVYSTDYRANMTANARENDLQACVLSGDLEPEALVLVAADPTAGKADPVHPDETADIQRTRDYRVQAGGKTYQLLRGEFHRHTELSSHRDQDGPFEEIWRYGLDVAHLDWIGPGDHDNGQREYPWWLTQKQVDFYHHAPTFLPMYTYERSVVFPSGHRNVMFPLRGIRPLPRLQGDEKLMGDAEGGSPDVKRLYAYLKHFGGVCASHTSATNMGTDWRDHDPEVEPVVEIYQGLRQNYEHKDAPMTAKDEQDSIGGYRPAGYVWNALQRGYRLGFEVSSDHVSTHLSYAVVLAEDRKRESIIGAFKKRHSYGAQDNIILIVRSGNHLMGDEFVTADRPTIEITAVGTAPIAKIAVVRGVGNEVPTYVYNAAPDAQEVSLKWTDDTAVAGKASYYYVRLEQADGKLAWASPMWIRWNK